jgi:aspartyl protease family protein
LIFFGVLAVCGTVPVLRDALGQILPPGAMRIDGLKVPYFWCAMTILAGGPYLAALIATDRLLSVRHGYAWLSGFAVAAWAGLAALFSPTIATALPANLAAGSRLMSFTDEAVVAAASLALLIHARALWIGLADQGFTGATLARSGAGYAWAPSDTRGWTARPTFRRPLSRLALSVSIATVVALIKSAGFVHGGGKPVPSATVIGPGEAEAWRTRNGSFFFPAMINYQSTVMLFDTGATIVALRAEDAERFGVVMDGLRYTLQSHTANGIAKLAPVRIDSITVGSITMHDVQAVVAQPGALRENLLGQTFLARLRDFKMEGDRVVLHAD